MGYLFAPPTVNEGPMGGNWLFARYTRVQGVSVLKINGSYVEMRFPSQDDFALAEVVYQGGHEYPVSAEEAASLQAAGYTVITT